MAERELPIRPVIGVLADNARRLRGEHTLAEVARAVSDLGLRWGTGRVAELEAGRVSPTLPTLLTLCQAYSHLLGRPVRLADLFAGAGRVAITHTRHLDVADLRAALRGKPIQLPETEITPTDALLRDYITHQVPEMLDAISALPPGRYHQLWRIWRACDEPEQRAAWALGVEMGRLVEAMADLWDHTLTEERDRRAGSGANAQRRGIVTRQLREDLRKAIHGDD